ncbi:MAG TPA: gliding motility-associated C-terminal domain-containing protein [Flavobacterium sp.]|jgi:gliding motility-associated-like protein
MPKFYFLLITFVTIAFSSQAVNAQLPDFTLMVTPHDEQCPGDGSLEFNVSGTATGASVLYEVYKLPDLVTPIATLAANEFGGLEAGTYRVIATQSLNGETSTQQQDAVINNTHVSLQFSVESTSCGGTGTITIDVTQGAGMTFEIYDGPVTFPQQTSNEFTGLPYGIYQIRVYDICGDGYALEYSLAPTNAGLSILAGTVTGATLPSCTTIPVRNSIVATTGNTIIYPLSLQYTVYPPGGGDPIIVNSTISAGSGFATTAVTAIPFYHGQQYYYDLTVTDGCGNTYTYLNNSVNRQLEVLLAPQTANCIKGLVVNASIYRPPFFVTFVSAPAGFDPVLYNAQHPGPFMEGTQYVNPDTPLPAGFYTVSVTDACGRTNVQTIEYDPAIEHLLPTFTAAPGCDPGMGSVIGAGTGVALESVVITAAPAAFGETLPFDISFNIDDGLLYMNSFPAGVYTFVTTDICGFVDTTVKTITGYTSSFTGSVTGSCDRFNLTIQHANNLTQNRLYLLQKFYPDAGAWGHPDTGVTSSGVPTDETGIALANGSNPNLQYDGSFRVVLVFEVAGNGTVAPVVCVQELYAFEYNYVPEIISILAYSCDTTSYDVAVDATGAGPLVYRITEKDGVPLLIENGISNLFIDLEPGVYNFQVEDICGNLMNRLFDTTEPFQYVVTTTGFCNGQTVTLAVPAFTSLNYEWWHEGDPSTILSTSPTLVFSPFDEATDTGLYHVHVFAPDTTPSCIDFIIDYEVTPSGTPPNAGNDVTETYCQNPGQVNLLSLLDTSDSSGTWQDLDAGVQLAGSFWNATPHVTGTYHFSYTVYGWCGASDIAFVTINLRQPPAVPVAHADAVLCSTETIELFADGDASNQYIWTGPNGFTSDQQNPVIDNATTLNSGTYTVVASSDGCATEPVSVEISVTEVAAFTVTAGCIDDEFTLTATTAGGLPVGATYSWTGPGNFAATGNPLVISQLPAGTYSVSVDTGNLCPATAQTTVASTLCKIPMGISPNADGDNDTFDLSGFDVEEIKIFNRYGMVVYDKANYVDEWDGRDYRGNELPSATYFYVVTMDTGEKRTGWVYLIRS